MKKILFSALLSTMSLGLFAQLTKGTIAFTGTAGLGGGKQKSESTSQGTTFINFDQQTKQFILLPGVGYFIKDNIEAGIAALVQRNTTINKNPNNFTQEIKTISPLNGVALFGNYYFKAAEKFSLYGGVQLGMGSGTTETTTLPTNGPTTIVKTKNSGSTFGLNAGFLYFVKTNIAINGTLGLLSFNNTKSKTNNNNVTTEGSNKSWAFGVNGIIINIGIKVFLMKKGTS